MKKIIIILMAISMMLVSCSLPSNSTNYDENSSIEETKKNNGSNDGTNNGGTDNTSDDGNDSGDTNDNGTDNGDDNNTDDNGDDNNTDDENETEKFITILSNQTVSSFNYYVTSGITKEKLDLISSYSSSGILKGVYNSHVINLSIRKDSNKLIISKFYEESSFQILEIKKDITNNKNIIIKIQFND